MPGGFDERNARVVLAMAERGEAVPIDVQDAAIRMQTGAAATGDSNKVARYLGNQRSGAGGIRKFRGRVQGVVNRFTRVGTSIEMAAIAAERQSGTVAANTALFNTSMQQLTDLSKSKFMRGMAQGMAEFMGRNPQVGVQFLKAITRGLRLGGAIGGTLLVGLGIADALVGGRDRLGRATSAIKDINLTFGGRSGLARGIEERNRRLIAQQAFFKEGSAREAGKLAKLLLPGGGGRGELGGDTSLLAEYIRATQEEDLAKRQAAEAKVFQGAREAFDELGVGKGKVLFDRNRALSEFARERGLSMELLSDAERQEALDFHTAGLVAFLERSANVKRQAQGEYEKLGYVAQAKLFFSGGTDAFLKEKQRDIALRTVAAQADAPRQRRILAAERLRLMTPKERYDDWEGAMQRRVNEHSHASRHRAVEVD